MVIINACIFKLKRLISLIVIVLSFHQINLGGKLLNSLISNRKSFFVFLDDQVDTFQWEDYLRQTNSIAVAKELLKTVSKP